MQTVLQKRLRNYLDSTGLSVAALERQAGLRINVARNILRGQSKKPTAETLQAISSVMGCTVADLLGVKRDVFPLENSLRHEQTRTEPSPMVENPEIFKDALATILSVSQEEECPLTVDQALLILGEVYTYSVKKPLPQIDRDFIKWFMEKTVR